MTGDERAQGAGPGRVTAGNGGERRGTVGNGSDDRSDAALDQSDGRLGGLSAQAAQPWATPRGKGGVATAAASAPAPVRSAAAISVSPGEPPGCPGLHWQGRAADWPFESAALSARPIVVVHVAGPGYEPSPIRAAGLADGGSLSCSA